MDPWDELNLILAKMEAWNPVDFDAQKAMDEWDAYVEYGITCFEKMLELEA